VPLADVLARDGRTAADTRTAADRGGSASEIGKAPPLTYAANVAARPTFVLMAARRETGRAVTAGRLSAVKTLSADFGLAADALKDGSSWAGGWMRCDNPLTWRDVNRSGSTTSAGPGETETSATAPPSHPELLDWLATELIRQQWSLKAMHRLIVLRRLPAGSAFDAEAAAGTRKIGCCGGSRRGAGGETARCHARRQRSAQPRGRRAELRPFNIASSTRPYDHGPIGAKYDRRRLPYECQLGKPLARCGTVPTVGEVAEARRDDDAASGSGADEQ
jgi:hypothetical protein